MGLCAGTRLGPYEITAPLGAGGMGEVYRARDTRLDRIVAIKVLNSSLASSPELKQRFEREARAISKFQHPHICMLHDIGSDNGTDFLVMEYLEGEALNDRLKRGPMPIQELLKVAIEIAGALERAHRAGIIHRDLKPGNVMLTKSGAKLLDFGLAKPVQAGAAAAAGSATHTVFGNALTMTSPASPLSSAGTVLGTLQYMSPEQIQGAEADARSDIFAFGMLLFELATGKHAFEGKNQASVVGKILAIDAPSVHSLRPEVSPGFDRVVRICLDKDPDQRFQCVHDLKLQLQDISEADPKKTSEAPAAASSRRTWLLSGALGVVAMIALAGWWMASRPVSHPLTRLRVDLGPDAVASIDVTVSISPDGRRLVFPVRSADGTLRLATRLLDQTQATVLPGTEASRDAFFSPDGEWMGFFTGPKLEKVSVQGGAPVTVGVAVNQGFGASWAQDGTIVAAMGSTTSISRMPAEGGARREITTLGPNENTHRWPQFLPDGSAVIFTSSANASSMENGNIEAVSLKTGKATVLVRGGYFGRYVPTGHLLYIHQGVLYGVKFDPERLEVHGSPVPMLQDVAANPGTGGGQFDFSNTGTLVYIAGKSAAQVWQLSWLDSSGKLRPLISEAGEYGLPRLSPDGRKLALLRNDDVYVYDLERDTQTRLTFKGNVNLPIWAPDGRHLIYASGQGVFWLRADGSSDPQKLLDHPDGPRPWTISPTGKWLAFFVRNVATGFDIWTAPLDLSDPEHPKAGNPEPLLHTPADEIVPRFSPDGRWVAYRSTESGTPEIYVRPFPASNGVKWQISSGGALYAFWTNDGRQLFYEGTDNRIMVMDYKVEGDSFVPGKPRPWSDTELFYTGTSNLDLAPDGKRFAVFSLPQAGSDVKGSIHVTMLFNFFDELKRRIP